MQSGAGEYRGGYGLVRDYRICNSNAELTTIASRYRYKPWGLKGGNEGSNNKVQVYHSDGKMIERATFSNYPLGNGDLIRFITGGGGGYGDPLSRDPKMVLEDVENEYITIKEANEIYKVDIKSKSGNIYLDIENTNNLRNNK